MEFELTINLTGNLYTPIEIGIINTVSKLYPYYKYRFNISELFTDNSSVIIMYDIKKQRHRFIELDEHFNIIEQSIWYPNYEKIMPTGNGWMDI